VLPVSSDRQPPAVNGDHLVHEGTDEEDARAAVRPRPGPEMAPGDRMTGESAKAPNQTASGL
jgi:hypothetical protein